MSVAVSRGTEKKILHNGFTVDFVMMLSEWLMEIEGYPGLWCTFNQYPLKCPTLSSALLTVIEMKKTKILFDLLCVHL